MLHATCYIKVPWHAQECPLYLWVIIIYNIYIIYYNKNIIITPHYFLPIKSVNLKCKFHLRKMETTLM